MVGTRPPGAALSPHPSRHRPPPKEPPPMPLGLRTAALTDQVLDTLQEGVLLSDADGLVTDANAAACRILRRAHEDLLGQPVTEVAAAPVDVSGKPVGPRDQPAARASVTGRTTAAVLGVARGTR